LVRRFDAGLTDAANNSGNMSENILVFKANNPNAPCRQDLGPLAIILCLIIVHVAIDFDRKAKADTEESTTNPKSTT
jgi:hypothetical protein